MQKIQASLIETERLGEQFLHVRQQVCLTSAPFVHFLRVRHVQGSLSPVPRGAHKRLSDLQAHMGQDVCATSGDAFVFASVYCRPLLWTASARRIVRL
jgi:hypothetical protein